MFGKLRHVKTCPELPGVDPLNALELTSPTMSPIVVIPGFDPTDTDRKVFGKLPYNRQPLETTCAPFIRRVVGWDSPEADES